ncbi:MAG TPA: radical SAM protein [Vicinamibacterales bacterium]|jgi:radical SAM protein with 4Fe4S-binding SPASM domain
MTPARGDLTPLEFTPGTHVIAKATQALVLNVPAGTWVRMPREGLEAVRSVVAGGHPTSAGVGTPASRFSPEAIRDTVAYLREHGFVRESAAEVTAPGAAGMAEPAPRALHLHVTSRCNLSCITCYMDADQRTGPDVLDLPAIHRLLDVAARCRFTRLIVTGGEPLLRRDIEDILATARSRFGSITLVTNGTLLTGAVAGMLAARVDSLNISLDGATADLNDRIRGAGTFARTIRGLETLRANGFPMARVSINPTVTRLNHEHLEDVVDVAAAFGADVSFGFFVPTGRGLCNRDRLTTSCADMFALHQRAVAKRLAAGGADADDGQLAMTRVRTDCRLDRIIAIHADGAIHPCPNLTDARHCLGRVSALDDAELERVLTSTEAKRAYLDRTVDRVPGCAGCECRYFCAGGCMAHAESASGNIYARDPYCAFYKSVWRHHGPLQDEYRSAAGDSPCLPAAAAPRTQGVTP